MAEPPLAAATTASRSLLNLLRRSNGSRRHHPLLLLQWRGAPLFLLLRRLTTRLPPNLPQLSLSNRCSLSLLTRSSRRRGVRRRLELPPPSPAGASAAAASPGIAAVAAALELARDGRTAAADRGQLAGLPSSEVDAAVVGRPAYACCFTRESPPTRLLSARLNRAASLVV